MSLVICYSEGEMVKTTLRSLTEQIYPGHIELVVVVDGARRNRETLIAVEALVPYIQGTPRRSIVVLPKFERGGRVSSTNLGLRITTGDIVMALDGDTSFDNDAVARAVHYFAEPGVVAVSGNLRVRNATHSLATRLQALEYMLAIHASRIGLDQFNAVNIMSGAFAVFRTDFLRRIGGWDNGAGEDLDITLRIKKYFRRHPKMRIRFAPDAVGHSDAPETFGGFFSSACAGTGTSIISMSASISARSDRGCSAGPISSCWCGRPSCSSSSCRSPSSVTRCTRSSSTRRSSWSRSLSSCISFTSS